MKRCLYALVAVTAVYAVLLVWTLQSASGPVNRSNYNKIRIGMTEAQVEALLGAPEESLPPLNHEDIHADEQARLLLASIPTTLRHWRSDTHMISVFFDQQERVVGKSYSHDPHVGLLRRVLDWLGL